MSGFSSQVLWDVQLCLQIYAGHSSIWQAKRSSLVIIMKAMTGQMPGHSQLCAKPYQTEFLSRSLQKQPAHVQGRHVASALRNKQATVTKVSVYKNCETTLTLTDNAQDPAFDTSKRMQYWSCAPG